MRTRDTRSSSARQDKGLLALLRTIVRYAAAHFDSSSAREAAQHSAEYSDEPILSRAAARAEALSIACPSNSRCAAVRESGSFSGASCKPSRLLFTTEFWPAR